MGCNKAPTCLWAYPNGSCPLEPSCPNVSVGSALTSIAPGGLGSIIESQQQHATGIGPGGVVSTGAIALQWADACQKQVDDWVKSQRDPVFARQWLDTWMLASGALGPGTVRTHGIDASYVPTGLGHGWWTIAVAWDATTTKVDNAKIADAIAALHRTGRLAWFEKAKREYPIPTPAPMVVDTGRKPSAQPKMRQIWPDSATWTAKDLDIAARTMIADSFAKVMGREPTTAERQIAQAVSRLETYYSRKGGKSGSPPNGVHHNWGGVMSTSKPPQCGPNSFAVSDAGKPVCMRWYETSEEGCRHFLETLFKKRPSVLLAAATGDAQATAKAMKATRYFGADTDVYARAIESNARELAANCGEPSKVHLGIEAPPGGLQRLPPEVQRDINDSAGTGLLLLAGAVLIGSVLLRRK